MKHLMILSLLILTSNYSVAAGSYTGTVEEVWINDTASEGDGWLKLTGSAVNSACGNGKWFAINLSQAESKYIISAALAAKVSNAQVSLGGNDTCAGQFEYLQYIAVK